MPIIPDVPLPEVQGIILRGYEFLEEARFLLLQFPDSDPADVGRRWLQAIVPSIRDATERPTIADTAVNLAFTYAGLKALGLSEKIHPDAPPGSSRFSREFQEGMDTSHRQRVLGDNGTSASINWDWGRKDDRPAEEIAKHNLYDAPVTCEKTNQDDSTPKPIHALLMLYAGDMTALTALYDSHVVQLGKAGIMVVRRLDTTDLLGRTEQFGFRDGIAQPFVLGVKKEPPVHEKESPNPGNQIHPGEILLGFPNAYDKLPVSPAVPATDGAGLVDFGYCGSYLVFRQLHQDVLKFWQFMDDATGRQGESAAESLAAKMVGRWPSGAPLALSPNHDDPSLRDADLYGFYKGDALGERVPIGSHTRRSNPRDSLEPGPGGQGRLTPEESLRVTRLHRMVRRGRPYGPAIARSMKPEDILKVGRFISSQYVEWKKDPTSMALQDQFMKDVNEVIQAAFDGQGVESMVLADFLEVLVRTVKEDRGLHFICFNASIARQFEFVQQTWINNPKFGGLYGDNDPIMGQRHTSQIGSADTFNEQGSPVRKRFQSLPEFVTVRGGAYFFMPGVKALKYLAGVPQELPPVNPKDLA
jgi:Dyp-type peroxidase family